MVEEEGNGDSVAVRVVEMLSVDFGLYEAEEDTLDDAVVRTRGIEDGVTDTVWVGVGEGEFVRLDVGDGLEVFDKLAVVDVEDDAVGVSVRDGVGDTDTELEPLDPAVDDKDPPPATVLEGDVEGDFVGVSERDAVDDKVAAALPDLDGLEPLLGDRVPLGVTLCVREGDRVPLCVLLGDGVLLGVTLCVLV